MIRPIHNKTDYKKVLVRVNSLWGAKQDTPKSDELEVLLVLIEDYENKHHSIPLSDPVERASFFKTCVIAN